ncbi:MULTISPECIES: hypothetical protein [unclassified Idiomarina]|jgi:hypothetical protein|uniref:hypothetical protein n=1 Tax=unclassified Idiomarina TaxID=2614829 RepID=UPI000C9059E5|nr:MULTISPECIES: hypothetical protein [unclassified Idiomarina]MAD53156.1 hypothetical protein [Idiomarinaceae bacterium]|tara:strand:+ start:3475 stop:3954 length:480 start_codon:yes stop_codon:yes gene_type:complete
MDIRTTLRSLILSEKDRFAIVVNKLLLFPEDIIANHISSDMPRYPYIAHTKKFSLEDITINLDGFDVAWIQSIVYDTVNNQLEIGHFALNRKLEGIGIGKRLAFALKNVVNEELFVTQILFKERSTNPRYPTFFENVLGATKVPAFPDGAGNDWHWNFA